MSNDPVEIARRIRAQRGLLRRVLRVSAPATVIGFAITYAAQSRVSDAWLTVVVVPSVLAFFTTWFSILGLWVLGVRDLRNMLRPGSAEAYGERR